MQVFSNLGYARLAATIDETATEMVVKDSKGIPSLNGGEYFLATLFKGSGERTENVEIVKVVGVVGNVWQIERNIEDTEPVTHFENTAIELRLTKGGLEQSGKQVLKPANTIVESDEKQFTSASEKESINNALSELHELVGSKVSKEEGLGLSANNFTDELLTKLNGVDQTFIKKTQKGVAEGVATLNESGELPESQMPLKTLNGESIRGEGNLVIEGGGSSGDVLFDSLTVSYERDTGRVEQLIETIGSEQRITTYTYSEEGLVATCVVEYLGKRRTETFSYNAEGNLLGITVILEDIA